MSKGERTIALMRPKLPDSAALAPYLKEIDENRWYSNFGPLERRFEARLAEHFAIGARELVCVSNGTQGLIVALQSVTRAPVGYCVMPAFTFAATAHAAVAAGLEPWFVDVEAETWTLTPEMLREQLPRLDEPVAAVMPVAPFGAAPDVAGWDAFCEETGIPVVIDAAASFDTAIAGHSPVMISLHATKALGIGEGGIVLCRRPDAIERARAGRNFGFREERVSLVAGTNAKLSEYGAAVGLAALDIWPETRARLAAVSACYHESFVGLEGVEFAPAFAGEGISSTCNVILDSPIGDKVIAALDGADIESRRWWNRGCHREPVFLGCRRSALPVSEDLAERVVGLPYHGGLRAAEIERIRDVMDAVPTG